MYTPYKNTAKFLKDARTKSKLSQSEVGEKCGDIHSQFVSNWERGQCAPPRHSFTKLIRTLQLDKDLFVRAMLMDAHAEIRAQVWGKNK